MSVICTIAGQWKRLTHQPHGVIPVCHNQSWKVKTMILQFASTRWFKYDQDCLHSFTHNQSRSYLNHLVYKVKNQNTEVVNKLQDSTAFIPLLFTCWTRNYLVLTQSVKNNAFVYSSLLMYISEGVGKSKNTNLFLSIVPSRVHCTNKMKIFICSHNTRFFSSQFSTAFLGQQQFTLRFWK